MTVKTKKIKKTAPRKAKVKGKVQATKKENKSEESNKDYSEIGTESKYHR